MPGNIKKTLFPGGAKGIGAWVVAGAVFGAWQYYENQRDNSTKVNIQDFREHNDKIKKRNPKG
tara:strand:- start:593 stop:781 length:189 start_codon:yes stop_codon:yes gene_type:complete